MESEVLKKLYLKILYNQKLIENSDLEDLIKEEGIVYNKLSEKDKVNYEINRIYNYKNNLNDSSSMKLFKIFSTRIDFLISEDNIDYDEVKRLIVIIDILLNISPSFYKALSEINKDYLDKELSRRL